jgi:hypothetical protein
MAYDQSFIQRARSSFMATAPGRSFTQGIGETFGMQYQHKGLFSSFFRPGGASEGFMGRKAAGGIMGGGVAGLLGKAVMPAFMIGAAYSGYKKGGVMGAVGGAAETALYWGATKAALTMATNPAVLAGAAVAGAGYGVYRLGEAARKHEKRVKGLEMGTEVVDRFGTLSTMRQRSLQAIQNSHLNGRMSLGSEGLLMSSPYRR